MLQYCTRSPFAVQDDTFLALILREGDFYRQCDGENQKGKGLSQDGNHYVRAMARAKDEQVLKVAITAPGILNKQQAVSVLAQLITLHPRARVRLRVLKALARMQALPSHAQR